MSLISEKHAALYQEYYENHDITPSEGVWEQEIAKLARVVGAKTILDYGCGAQVREGKFSGAFEVIYYDPGVKGLTDLPPPCDVVVCMDVLEHIEPECLDDVLWHLSSLAKKAAFFTISCQESESKTLPDGSAWHSFVQPKEWWKGILPTFSERPSIGDRNEFVCMWKRPQK